MSQASQSANEDSDFRVHFQVAMTILIVKIILIMTIFMRCINCPSFIYIAPSLYIPTFNVLNRCLVAWIRVPPFCLFRIYLWLGGHSETETETSLFSIGFWMGS